MICMELLLPFKCTAIVKKMNQFLPIQVLPYTHKMSFFRTLLFYLAFLYIWHLCIPTLLYSHLPPPTYPTHYPNTGVCVKTPPHPKDPTPTTHSFNSTNAHPSLPTVAIVLFSVAIA